MNTQRKKDNYDESTKVSFDLNNKYVLKQILGYSVIFLNDKKQYDRLLDLQNNLEYYAKIMKNYGYNPHTGEYNEKMLPEPKEEKQKKNIAKDFKVYFKTLEEYVECLKELIKKYDIKPKEDLLKIAFSLNNNNNNDNEYKQRDFKFIRVDMDWQDLFPNA